MWGMTSPLTPPPPQQIKKHLLTLMGMVVVVHAAFIGAYYAFHIRDRTEKTQQAYVAVWVVCTLLVVVPLMKRIRHARRRR
jgi:multidrug resistance efflux pump